MVLNTRSFIKNILEDDEEFDERPACYGHQPSIGGLDYLVTDFQFVIDFIINSIKKRLIYDHSKFDVLFELAHSLYNLLETFRSKYISKIYNEQ